MDCVPHFEQESTGDLGSDKASSSVDIIDVEKDEKLDETKTFDNSNDNSNFQSVNLAGEKGEFGDQSEQENKDLVNILSSSWSGIQIALEQVFLGNSVFFQKIFPPH